MKYSFTWEVTGNEHSPDWHGPVEIEADSNAEATAKFEAMGYARQGDEVHLERLEGGQS